MGFAYIQVDAKDNVGVIVDPAVWRMVPAVKASSRTAFAERRPDLTSNAGRVATGAAGEDVGWEIFHFDLDVVSGKKKTWAKHWGPHNAVVPFNPVPIT